MRDRPVERPDLLDARATITLVVAALILSVRRFQGFDLDLLRITYETWPSEPWRLFTSCLLHGGWLHLAFNLYWIFRLGSILEPALGLLTTIALFLLLGTTSSAAEWAFNGSSVGLSGIVYGLFGLLWALHRYHPNYRGVISEELAWFFVGWFFFCIFLTVYEIMPIGNFAHGVGAVMGFAFGLTLTPLGPSRLKAWTGLVSLTLLIGLACTVGRPYVNFGGQRAWELQIDAYRAFEDEDPQRAADLLEQSLDRDPESSHAWHNLGVAYRQLGRFKESAAAIARQEQLERLDAEPATTPPVENRFTVTQ